MSNLHITHNLSPKTIEIHKSQTLDLALQQYLAKVKTPKETYKELQKEQPGLILLFYSSSIGITFYLLLQFIFAS